MSTHTMAQMRRMLTLADKWETAHECRVSRLEADFGDDGGSTLYVTLHTQDSDGWELSAKFCIDRNGEVLDCGGA